MIAKSFNMYMSFAQRQSTTEEPIHSVPIPASAQHPRVLQGLIVPNRTSSPITNARALKELQKVD